MVWDGFRSRSTKSSGSSCSTWPTRSEPSSRPTRRSSRPATSRTPEARLADGETMAHKGMRFGIFLAPFHRLGENPTLALGRDMELIEWLDALGYDEVWVGEHH